MSSKKHRSRRHQRKFNRQNYDEGGSVGETFQQHSTPSNSSTTHEESVSERNPRENLRKYRNNEEDYARETERTNPYGASSSSNTGGASRNRPGERPYNYKANRRGGSHGHFHRRKSPSPESKSDNFEIPGFFYDEAKKKYFKILPNHNNAVSGSVTRDVIKNIKVEKQRQEDLKSLGKQSQVLRVTTRKPRCLQSNNCYDMLFSCVTGQRTPVASRSLLYNNIVKKFVHRATDPIVKSENAWHGIEKIDDSQLMILSKDGKTVYGVWSLGSALARRMHPVFIKHVKRCDDKVHFKIGPTWMVCTPQEKVTSLCWAPESLQDTGTRHILFTTTSFIGDSENSNNMVWLYNDFYTLDDRVDYDIGPTALWTAAWNCHKKQFSVGTETNTVLVDAQTKTMSEFSSDNSSVYALSFSVDTGQTLYSGTKAGKIFAHDMRSSSTLPVSSFSHENGISHLYPSKFQHHVVASDVSGQIKTWDLRQKQVVLEYPGHKNQYVRQPFHVDDRENILCAAGEDCYTRIWCYRTAKLLQTIPSPAPVSIDSIPRLAFSDNIGGNYGMPGLLMAVKAHFHLYTF